MSKFKLICVVLLLFSGFVASVEDLWTHVSTSVFATYVALLSLGSSTVLQQLFLQEDTKSRNGYVILVHLGVDNHRANKMYHQLSELISVLKSQDYSLVKINKLFAQ